MKLTKRQRENLAKVFLDLSKYIFIALVVGQLVVPEKFKIETFVGGSIAFLVFLLIGLLADRGE